MSERAKPKPYQKDGVEDIECFEGRALLADEMGLGKTLQALWFRARNPQISPTVIVTPAHLKYQWEREAAVHTDLRYDIAEGRTPPKHPHHRRDGIIINYEILHWWLPYIKEHVKPKSVFLDEVHFISNPKAKRSAAVRKLCKNIDSVVAMSGTPLVNRPAELWHTLHVIRPDLFPSFWSFAHEYCKPRLKRWGWDFSGSNNLPQLHKLLKTYLMVRRLKSDVLTDLPAKIRSVVPIEISDIAEYRRATDNFLSWLRVKDAAAAARARNAEKLTQVGYLLRLAGKLKCKAAVTWINNYLTESDEKMLVFGKHQQMIRALEKKIDAKHVTIDGNVGKRERQNRVDQFNGDPNTRVLIGSEAAITGLNLTAASTVIFTELFWRPGDHTQAEDRIHRIGQENTSWIYYLVANGTIENRLCELIQGKQEVLSSVLDGGEITNQLSVFSQLIGELENGPITSNSQS